MSQCLFRRTGLCLSLALMFWVGCSKESNSPVAKLYHNTTAYFNGYYNANEIMKAARKSLEESYTYPNGNLFQVYHLGGEREANNVEPDMEMVIDKAEVMLYKHPNSALADDAYLMVMRANIFRQDFYRANQSLDYFLENYPESKRLAEARLWQARMEYAQNGPELAQSMLDEYVISGLDTLELRKKARVELAVFRAQLAAELENYELAAELLAGVVDEVKGRRNRAEAYFLLGQLYDRLGRYGDALATFERVEKYSADYDLTFRSKLRIARLYVVYQEGQDDDQQVYRYLDRMLRDRKNEEYRDQIYYELALLAQKKQDPEEAETYFRQAIGTGGTGHAVALSAFALGNQFFDEQTYDSAQVYYDLAAANIKEEDAEYEEITTLATTLRDYVAYRNTITYQDSMLYLASLDSVERERIVLGVIAAERKAEQERKRAEQEALRAEQEAQLLAGNSRGMNNNPFLQNNGQPGNRQRGGATFYFDNPTAVSQGIQQFQQRWGERPNIDHWRRNKQGIVAAQVEEEEVVVDSSLVEEFGDDYKYYLDIPRNDSMVAAANEKIEDALYNLGQLYAQKLNEPDSAIKTFEYLLDRYEGSDYTLRARYALYNLYKAQDNPIYRAQEAVIVNEFPRTIYAYLIQGKDPNELKETQEDFRYAYTGLFSAYRDRQYETAIGFAEFLLEQFAESDELDFAKLHYIRGMSFGYLGEKDSLAKSLTYVVNNFPDAEVTPLARKTLQYLQGGLPTTTPSANISSAASSIPASNFPTAGEAAAPNPGILEGINLNDPALRDPGNARYSEFATEIGSNDKIFVLVLLDAEAIPKSELQRQISDFNRQAFPNNGLKSFVFQYQQTYVLPYVSDFANVDAAQSYIQTLKEAAFGKEQLLEANAEIFYISHSNFKVAYGRKKMQDYVLFYRNVLAP